MQQEFSAISTQIQSDSASHYTTAQQHGLQYHDPSGSAHRSLLRQTSGGVSPRSVRGDASFGVVGAGGEGANADSLQERLRRLNDVHEESNAKRSKNAGQRISEYENALTPAVPRQALGFKVIKRADSRSDGVQLSDFPNGTLYMCHPFLGAI